MGWIGGEMGSTLRGQQVILTDCHLLRIPVVGNGKGKKDLGEECAVINQ